MHCEKYMKARSKQIPVNETAQLPDKVVYLAASSMALLGIVLLFAVAPEEDEQRYVLSGTVVERHGRTATVLANVTVVGRDLSGTIEREVFWNGEAFIALTPEKE